MLSPKYIATTIVALLSFVMGALAGVLYRVESRRNLKAEASTGPDIEHAGSRKTRDLFDKDVDVSEVIYFSRTCDLRKCVVFRFTACFHNEL